MSLIEVDVNLDEHDDAKLDLIIKLIKKLGVRMATLEEGFASLQQSHTLLTEAVSEIFPKFSELNANIVALQEQLANGVTVLTPAQEDLVAQIATQASALATAADGVVNSLTV